MLTGIHTLAVWVATATRGVRVRRRQKSSVLCPGTVWPFVSVVVPAWQERGTLEACVMGLRAVDYPRWEAVIVAGGADGTLEAARTMCTGDAHFRVIEQQPRGKNAALNQGLYESSSEIIAVLDADSRVSPGWLKALVLPLALGVSASTGNPQPILQTPVSLSEQMERIAAWEVQNRVILQGSGGIAIRRQVLDRLGGFPEDVEVGVDWDLDARLASQGLERVFCDEAIVHTHRPATLCEYWRNQVRWRRAHWKSLFWLPSHFLRSPISCAVNLYIYMLAWFIVLLTLAACVTIAVGSEFREVVLPLWAIFVAWIFLRRIALAIEVATCRGSLKWLMLFWMPPLLLGLDLLACACATLTWKANRMHFKGPRPG